MKTLINPTEGYLNKIKEMGYDCYLNGGDSFSDNPFPTNYLQFNLFREGYELAERHDKSSNSFTGTIKK